jgi:hypothetical protein
MTTKTTSPLGRIVGGVLAFGVALAMILVVGLGGAMNPPLVLNEGLPALNSAGDSVFAELFVSDGTGVVVTPNDAGVFTAIAGAPLTLGQTDGSGCITASITTGLFTTSTTQACGTGKLLLTACVNRAAGSSNVAGTTTGAWVKNGTVLATTAASRLLKVETVDAGNAYAVMGCAETIVTAAKGDTFGFFATNAGGGITATFREGQFRVQKILN